MRVIGPSQIGQIVQCMSHDLDPSISMTCLGVCGQDPNYVGDIQIIVTQESNSSNRITINGAIHPLNQENTQSITLFPSYDPLSSPAPPIVKSAAKKRVESDEQISLEAKQQKLQKELERAEKLRQMELKVKAFKDRKASAEVQK